MITITIIFPSLSRGKEKDKDTFKTHFQITEREREVFFKAIFYLFTTRFNKTPAVISKISDNNHVSLTISITIIISITINIIYFIIIIITAVPPLQMQQP